MNEKLHTWKVRENHPDLADCSECGMTARVVGEKVIYEGRSLPCPGPKADAASALDPAIKPVMGRLTLSFHPDGTFTPDTHGMPLEEFHVACLCNLSYEILLQILQKRQAMQAEAMKQRLLGGQDPMKN